MRCDASPTGTVTITGQRLRVGRTYAGHTVAIAMEDKVFRVLHNDVVFVTPLDDPAPRITRFNAYSRRQQAFSLLPSKIC
jgi:hypothetical protein